MSDRDHPAINHPALGAEIERGINGLDVAVVARPVTDVRARRVLADLAWQAYQVGRHDALRELVTTEQAAAMLGVSQSRVVQLARSRGLGWQVGPRTWVLRPDDVAAMRERTPGRPHTKPQK